MSKFFKGDVTNGVVEFNLLDPAVGAGGTTATVVTKNTPGPNVVEQIVGDIPEDRYSFGSNGGYFVKGLVIGTSCTSIGSNAFNYCFALTGDLVIPDSVTSIDISAFYLCSGLTSLTIGNSVTIIDTNAFYTCSALTGDLVIPDSVTSIGSFAFAYCSSITALYTNTPAASWFETDALNGTTALVNIYYGPNTNDGAGYSATFQGGSGMTVSAWTNYPNIP